MQNITQTYKDEIAELINEFPLHIDTEIKIKGRAPTLASSEFLTNKEQGDWAERMIYEAINHIDSKSEYFAVQYGRSDSIAAGDDGFDEFYTDYQNELNRIGKKPDILLFKKSKFPDKNIDLSDHNIIKKAAAALEVRSSSFITNKYNDFMEKRKEVEISNCINIINELTEENNANILKEKNEKIYEILISSKKNEIQKINFRIPSWSSVDDKKNEDLIKIKSLLKKLKESINKLKKRDHLSITPKIEDISLVNRWIKKYNVKHFYLQVFFDKSYLISFKEILKLSSSKIKNQS